MRIVQVGLGVWGENHTKILAEMGLLGAICDFDSKKGKEIGDKYSVKYYESIDKLLENENFEGAFVGNNSSKNEIIFKLLSRKKHVFVEKPMTLDSSEGEKLKELSEKNKVLLTSGFDERSNPAIQFVKQSVEEKKYGEIKMLDIYRQNKISSEENFGIFFESSINDIDICNVVYGQYPIVVFARSSSDTEMENFSSIMLGYKENKTAVIISNGNSAKKARQLKAFYSQNIVFSNLETAEIQVSNGENRLLEKTDSMILHIKNFIDAIEGKVDLLVTPQEIVNLTKITEAALLSSQKGAPIYLDLK